MDNATQKTLHSILRREGRSLFQYLREVPPWAGLREQNAVARLREVAAAELEVTERLGKMLQRAGGESHLGAFRDFTPYNDTAMHFILPAVVREQKQHLAELERDRQAITDADVGALLDRLLELKRLHVVELGELHTMPHTFTTVNV